MVGLGDKKYNFISIKVIEDYEKKSLQFTEKDMCVRVYKFVVKVLDCKDSHRKNMLTIILPQLTKCVFFFFFYVDVDECFEIPDVCGPNSVCNNTVGSHNCSCKSGYNVTDPNLPINSNNTCKVCGPNSQCYNYNGSILCCYNFNYFLIDYVDECVEISDVRGPNSICNNTVGSHNCSCKSGYNVTDPNLPINSNNTCKDVDECVEISDVCGPNSICNNTVGSHNCSCMSGYNFCFHCHQHHQHLLQHLQQPLQLQHLIQQLQQTLQLQHLLQHLQQPLQLQHLIQHLQPLQLQHLIQQLQQTLQLQDLLQHLQQPLLLLGISSLPNSTTEIQIPEIPVNTPITVIVFTTLDSILPTRDTSSNGSIKSDVRINGDVVVVKVDNKTINNISFAFDITNQSLGNPQCVFWSFNLDAWDSTGCKAKPYKSKGNGTGKITCECNHTTSFSILMSPFSVDHIALAYITYIGVAISMASLIICLIIETIVWKSTTRNDTSYMRHVSIVNIAVSLLIANICFIIGAAIAEQEQPTSVGRCSPAVFFMHFFYLSLFFWMLMSALLLFYRTVMVLSQMSRAKMMAIAFIVGYGAPLLIAVITVASTAGPENYISKRNACWLNWLESKALLAFVIPALTIVAINLVVLIVVLYKMLRRGVGAATQPDEKHALVVIARCVAILTPIFGLTWGFGIGTMVSQELGIHVVFALLNSLQVLLSFLTTSLFILTLCEVYILCALFKCSNCNVNNAIIIILYHCNNPL
uniref:Uncharacterized protein n=1 Tax=Cyprinus carpio TaxID=7962 RepID=A0A8C1UYD8_CYPCA